MTARDQSNKRPAEQFANHHHFRRYFISHNLIQQEHGNKAIRKHVY